MRLVGILLLTKNLGRLLSFFCPLLLDPERLNRRRYRIRSPHFEFFGIYMDLLYADWIDCVAQTWKSRNRNRTFPGRCLEKSIWIHYWILQRLLSSQTRQSALSWGAAFFAHCVVIYLSATRSKRRKPWTLRSGPTTSFSDCGTRDLYSDVSQSPRIQRMIYTWIDSKDTSWHRILLPIFQFAVPLALHHAQPSQGAAKHPEILRRNIWLRDASNIWRAYSWRSYDRSIVIKSCQAFGIAADQRLQQS